MAKKRPRTALSERRPRTALKQAREELGLSQHEAAQLAGYTDRAAWCQIETGLNTPSLERMGAIAKVVKRPAVELFEELRAVVGEVSPAGPGSK